MNEFSAAPRDRLVEAAMTLFYAKSYAGVGVQDICEAAGLQKGSFYHFFPSKRDLAVAALDAMQRRLIQFVFEPAYRPKRASLERVRHQFERAFVVQNAEYCRSGQMKGCFLGNLGTEMSTQDDSIRAHIATLFEELSGWIERAVREAVDAGDLPDTTDTRATALAILAYFEGVLLLSKTQNDPSLIRRLAPAAGLCIIEKAQAEPPAP